MTAQLVWDAFKGLLISLRPPTIFPAAIFVLAQVYVASHLMPGFEYDSTESVILWIGLIVLCSYMLHGAGFRLKSIFMGKEWSHTHLGKILLNRQLRIRDDFLKSWDKKMDNFPALQCEFPLKEPILPTKFGNRTRAIVEYPYWQYGINWDVLQSCFEPILAEKNYLPFVNQEKDVLSLFMNMAVVSIILGMEFFYLYLFLGNPVAALVAVMLALGFVLLFCECMLAATHRLGQTIRTACALYRHELYKSLGLQPSSNAEEEKRNWRAISEFILNSHPYANYYIKNDYYQVITPQSELFGVKKIKLFGPYDTTRNADKLMQ